MSSIPVQSRKVANILNSGMNSSVSGIRYVRNTPVARMPEPQNFMRESANAAGTLISMVMMTVNTATIDELRKNVRNAGEPISSEKFASVGWKTHHGLVAAEISADDFRPVMSM